MPWIAIMSPLDDDKSALDRNTEIGLIPRFSAIFSPSAPVRRLKVRGPALVLTFDRQFGHFYRDLGYFIVI
jgi:hypothetical protein